MNEIVTFLQALAENNNREWFLDHKDEYVKCKGVFDSFVAELIQGIRAFDDSIGPLDPKDCIYRIYRDTRFSNDKTPYKTHFGAFIVPQGKKSGYGGYYFQIGAYDKGFPGGCMLATGNYIYEPKALKVIREDISMDDGEAFQSTLDAAKGFYLDKSDSLKRVPLGFSADKPYSEYLKLKSFCLLKEPGIKYMTSDDLLKKTLRDFNKTTPFLSFINRAISFSQNNS